jgi:hypothetical protein
MLDSDLDDALEDSDGVFRNELLERDQEGSLESYTTTDGGKADRISTLLRAHSAGEKGAAYDRITFPVAANQATYITKLRKFGTRETTSRNFPNSAEPHARSKYFPP